MVEVGFTQSVYTVGEGEGAIELFVTKSGLNAREVGVAFTTKDGTAMRKSPLSQCSLQRFHSTLQLILILVCFLHNFKVLVIIIICIILCS